jgi:hypothetical protein
LEVAVQAAAGAELGWDRLPVTARPQYVEDAVEDAAIIEAGPTALGGSSDTGQMKFEAFPECVRNPEVVDNRGARSGHERPPVRIGRPAQVLFAPKEVLG